MGVKVLKESEVAPWLSGMTSRNRWYIFCPGCYEESKQRNPEKPRWWIQAALHCFNTDVHQFNGNREAPTLSPSLMGDYGEGEKRKVCHCYVRDGMIQFLGDCTHPMKNQTLPLMDAQPYLDYLEEMRKEREAQEPKEGQG